MQGPAARALTPVTKPVACDDERWWFGLTHEETTLRRVRARLPAASSSANGSNGEDVGRSPEITLFER
jgi:hypothetical protein